MVETHHLFQYVTTNKGMDLVNKRPLSLTFLITQMSGGTYWKSRHLVFILQYIMFLRITECDTSLDFGSGPYPFESDLINSISPTWNCLTCDVVMISPVSPAGIFSALQQPWQSAEDSCWRGPHCSKPHCVECTSGEQRGGRLVAACKSQWSVTFMSLTSSLFSGRCFCWFFLLKLLKWRMSSHLSAALQWPQSLIFLTVVKQCQLEHNDHRSFHG